jgi:hypothetical protein
MIEAATTTASNGDGGFRMAVMRGRRVAHIGEAAIMGDTVAATRRVWGETRRRGYPLVEVNLEKA